MVSEKIGSAHLAEHCSGVDPLVGNARTTEQINQKFAVVNHFPNNCNLHNHLQTAADLLLDVTDLNDANDVNDDSESVFCSADYSQIVCAPVLRSFIASIAFVALSNSYAMNCYSCVVT